jgi:RecA/RadA recombinase
MCDNLSTGIGALNDLLGGKGLKRGSVILIRGAPGTGKTTLALLIARNAVREEKHNFVFLSVEEPPNVLLNQITQSLWDKDYQGFFAERSTNASGECGEYRVEHMRTYWEALDMPSAGQRRTKQDLDKVFQTLWIRLGLHPNHDPKMDRPVLLVIDSLNALIDGSRVRFQCDSDREMLLTVLDSIERLREIPEIRLTVMFMVEEIPGVTGLDAESYIADTVIRLRRETLTSQMPVSPDAAADWKRDLLFCQVLKGRGMPIQRRDCCYEFAKGTGLKFFPTYAAQGLVSLFYENQPQHDVIDDLRTIDVPSSYPEVLVQQFTRSGLQNMFAVRRYTDLVPLRHPMMLSNVDTYWVDVLRKNGLLHPINRTKLKLYSLPFPDSRVLRELVAARGEAYCDGEDYLAVPQMANVSMLVYRKDLLQAINAPVPETWEQLEDICRQLRDRQRPYKLLLETQTYDTLLITALEMGWGHGAYWYTDFFTKGDYTTGEEGLPLKIVFKEGEFDDFVNAMTRLNNLIHKDRIVPLRSSVDPTNYQKADWAFARHWYSTWVDVLTRTDNEGKRVSDFGEYAEFGFAKLPVSQDYHDRQTRQLQQPPASAAAGAVKHHSSWGEWYLALQKGSENVELGIDLLNNLMTSRKVVERALSGAALPTVEKFYETCGVDICFGTDMTYNEIRNMFFEDCRSRSKFANYYEMAGVLAGTLRAILSNPLSERKGEPPAVRVRKLLWKAFHEIDPTFGDTVRQVC